MGYAAKALSNMPVTENVTAPPINTAIIFLSRTSIRPLIRQELKSAGVSEVFTVETLDSCIEHLIAYPVALLVIDWEVGAENVNRTLKAAQGRFRVDTRPIMLIATEVSSALVAVGGEYQVSRIHTGEISRGAVQDHIDLLLEDEAVAAKLRIGLTQVAAARANCDFAAAEQILRQLVSEHPSNRRLVCELADNLIQTEQWNEALALLEKMGPAAAELDLRVEHLKARCLMKRGDFAGASSLLQLCKLINPYHADRLVDLGRALLHCDKIREALNNFDMALSLDRNHAGARSGAFQCRLLDGDVNDALALMRQMSGPRELASVFNNAAILAIRQGRFAQGLSLYRTAIGALGGDPTLQARLVFNLGIGFYKAMQPIEARECFDQAARIDPLFSNARHNSQVLTRRYGVNIAEARPGEFDEERVDTIEKV